MDEVERYIDQLSNDHWQVREKAAKALGKLGKPKAVHALIQALKDESEDVRCEAAKALGEIKDPLSIYPLIETFSDTCDVAFESVNSLSKMGKKAVDALINTIKYGRRSSMREYAVYSIGKIKQKRVRKHLIEALLDDENDSVRSAAASELGDFKDESAIPGLIKLLEEDPSSLGIVASSLSKIGSPAIPALRKALNSKKAHMRRSAAEAFEKITDATFVPLLSEKIKDPDSEVRISVVSALGKIGDPLATPALIEALQDENARVRHRAVVAIGQIGDPSAVSALFDLLNDEEKPSGVATIGELSSLTLANMVKRYETFKDLEKFECKLAEQIEKSKKNGSKILIQIGKLRIEITKRKNELSKDKAILLDDKPKPPKGNKMYQQLRRATNG
jgi:HEAT repeat protein